MTDNTHYNDVVHLVNQFGWEHLPTYLQTASKPFHDLAVALVADMGHGPELVAGLRKLLEAKDCVVRQAVADRHV
jgi:hypothetical protein